MSATGGVVLALKSLIEIFEAESRLSTSWKLWKEFFMIELLSINCTCISWWCKLGLKLDLGGGPWDLTLGGSMCLLTFAALPFDCCFRREFCLAVIFALSSAATDLPVFVATGGDDSEWNSWLVGALIDPFCLCSSVCVTFSCFFHFVLRFWNYCKRSEKIKKQ